MEPPLKKARIDLHTSKSTDQANKAAAVAAKLSQTLLGFSKPSANYILERQPVRVRPSVTSFLGLPEPESIHVPSERVGQIIGKGGLKIREIQEKAQIRMDIAKESNPNTPHLREIKLTGTKEGIEKCKKLLEELYAQVKIREGGAPDRAIEVPINIIGLVIGRGGETIRRIIAETKCIIQIEKNEDWRASGRKPPKAGHQNVYLKGDKEAVDKAEKTISDLVAGAGERRRPPQNYGGGQMPHYGMQQTFPQPYGMPPGLHGNNFAPGQNYAPPQPYHQGQMQAPQMYNQQPNPYTQGPLPQPYPQAQLYPQQGQPYNPQGQPYNPQGQAYNPQGQPYNPQGQPYNPQGEPYNPQAQPYTPGQAPYNPAAPPAQNQVPPQMQGYGGFSQSAPSSQTPYNPAQAPHNPPFVPSPQNQNGYQNSLPNQPPGHMTNQLAQIPNQPSYQANQVPEQQNTQMNPIPQQQNTPLNPIPGQQNNQKSMLPGQQTWQPQQLPGQTRGQLNQLSGTQNSHGNLNYQGQNLNQVPTRQPTG